MLVEEVETRRTEIALRQEAHYWRALHARAVEREAAWKERAGQLERIVRDQAAQIAELTRENEALKARVAWLEQQVFGRKSELPQDVTPEAQDGDGKVPAGPEPSTVKRRKRGKQRCPICGKPFVVFPGTDDSEVIEWEVRLVLPRPMKHRTMTTLREKLIKIGAKAVHHARYVVFQMAEVAVSRKLFAAILDRIQRLHAVQVLAPS